MGFVPIRSPEYVAGMRLAVTTQDTRYAEIGVVVDGDYRQLNANILQIENEYYQHHSSEAE